MQRFIVRLDNMDNDTDRTIAVCIVPYVSVSTAWVMVIAEALKMKQNNELLTAVELLSE